MSEKVLKVKMFGSFELFYGGKKFYVGRNINSRLIQLMQLLLLNVEAGGVLKESLISTLYGRDEIKNGNGSLNSAIFRLRKNLSKAGLPDCEYVILQNGRCRWNEEIPVEVDVIQFERFIRKGRKEKNISRRMESYQKACRLYTGELLPELAGEDWVRIRGEACQSKYTTVLAELCEWLMEQKRFEEVCSLSGAAAKIYPFGDWNLYQIDSLIAMTRYSEAMQVYEDATKLFFDELGLHPSQEMLERAHMMAERLSQSTEEFADIWRRLREKEKKSGAYYCTYPNFIDSYHVVSRMAERVDLSVFVLICTLTYSKNDKETDERELSCRLGEAILQSLRRGDFFTKYSMLQHLVVLTGIRREDCAKVSAKIEAAFYKKAKKGTYKFGFSVLSVEEINRIEASGIAWMR